MVASCEARRYTYLPQASRYIAALGAGCRCPHQGPSFPFQLPDGGGDVRASLLLVPVMKAVELVDSRATEELLEHRTTGGHVSRTRHPPVFAADRALELRIHLGRLSENAEID